MAGLKIHHRDTSPMTGKHGSSMGSEVTIRQVIKLET